MREKLIPDAGYPGRGMPGEQQPMLASALVRVGATFFFPPPPSLALPSLPPSSSTPSSCFPPFLRASIFPAAPLSNTNPAGFMVLGAPSPSQMITGTSIFNPNDHLVTKQPYPTLLQQSRESPCLRAQEQTLRGFHKKSRGQMTSKISV